MSAAAIQATTQDPDELNHRPSVGLTGAMVAAGASPFLGLVGRKPLIHDPVSNPNIPRISREDLARQAQVGDIVLTSRDDLSWHKNLYKAFSKPISGSEFYHVEPVTHQEGGEGRSLEAGRLWGMDANLEAAPEYLRKRYGHKLNFDDMVLLRPNQKMTPQERATYLDAITRGSAAQYSKPAAVSSWLKDIFLPKVPLSRNNKVICADGTCSTVPAQALSEIGHSVIDGVHPKRIMPSDFLGSDKYTAVGASLKNPYKNTLGRRLLPYASRAAIGGLLAGGVYGGSKLYNYLKSKTQPGREVTAGILRPYRFAHSAEEISKNEALNSIFDAHDRKPFDTGSESSNGLLFQEGVTG